MSLFALEVNQKPVGATEPLTNVLHVSQACLAQPEKAGKSTIKVIQDGKPFTLAVLEGNKLPHAQLNHYVDPMTTKFLVEGATVHLTGFYELPGPDENVDDLMDEEEEESSDEEGMEDMQGESAAELQKAQALMNQKLQSLEKTSNMVPVMEDGESDEEEEEEEEEGEEMDSEEEAAAQQPAAGGKPAGEKGAAKGATDASDKTSVSKPAIEAVALKEGDDEESDLGEMDGEEEEEEEDYPELTSEELKEMEAAMARQGFSPEDLEEEEEEDSALIAAIQKAGGLAGEEDLEEEEEEEEEESDEEDEAPPAKKAKRA